MQASLNDPSFWTQNSSPSLISLAIIFSLGEVSFDEENGVLEYGWRATKWKIEIQFKEFSDEEEKHTVCEIKLFSPLEVDALWHMEKSSLLGIQNLFEGELSTQVYQKVIHQRNAPIDSFMLVCLTAITIMYDCFNQREDTHPDKIIDPSYYDTRFHSHYASKNSPPTHCLIDKYLRNYLKKNRFRKYLWFGDSERIASDHSEFSELRHIWRPNWSNGKQISEIIEESELIQSLLKKKSSS